MATSHIVIVDSHLYDLGDDFIQERAVWEALGATFTTARCERADELIAAGHKADVLVYFGLYTPFTAEVLAQLPHCRLIARYGIGMDSVDLEAATALGIVVANAAEFCVPEVADHTTALILGLARRIPHTDRYVRAGHWAGAVSRFGPIQRLSSQTVGLVGFGRIGRRVAQNLRPMVGGLLAYDPYVAQTQADDYGVRMTPLTELLTQADFVSIHTPLMPQTRGLIGADQLGQMKPSAYLINTSRGPVVDEAALVDALTQGQIAGAALDVFDPEPLADNSPLRQMEHVILTPHIAANSVQAIDDLRIDVTENVAAILRGAWPRHVMNPTVTPKRALQPRALA